MRPIKFKNWLLSVLFLIGLGLVVDYYFIHILFSEKVQVFKNLEKQEAEALTKADIALGAAVKISRGESATSESAAPAPDNFLESLQSCLPEISSQGVATPEAFIEYLKKSIGVRAEDMDVENYHLKMNDGSVRRIHVIPADNTNSKTQKEFRLFKLDDEGYPERLPLTGKENLASLLAQGHVYNKETRGHLALRDGSTLALETHNDDIYEFQYKGHGKTLSCRVKSCLCQ